MYNIEYQSRGMGGGREVEGGHIMSTTTQVQKLSPGFTQQCGMTICHSRLLCMYQLVLTRETGVEMGLIY